MKLNIVPARTGITWVRLGITTFFRQPLALAGLFFLYMAVLVAISAIPFIGNVVSAMLVPAASLGLMAATAEASKGKFPMPTVLISAFRAGRERLRAMLVLGVIYAAGALLATGLAELLMGDIKDATQVNPQTLVAFALHTPLILMFWHAPALVHWHGVSPGKSLFFSVVACIRNLGALTVYILLWALVLAGVVFLFGTIGLLLGGPSMAQVLIVPVIPLILAMISTSPYFTFRDSFVADDEPQPPGESP